MSDGEYKIFDRYKVGRRIGIFKSQTDETVDELHSKGLAKKIGSSKVLLTFEGKEEFEKLRSNDPS
jgi:Mn-dependent DtxR family transcriptional regulator